MRRAISSSGRGSSPPGCASDLSELQSRSSEESQEFKHYKQELTNSVSSALDFGTGFLGSVWGFCQWAKKKLFSGSSSMIATPHLQQRPREYLGKRLVKDGRTDSSALTKNTNQKQTISGIYHRRKFRSLSKEKSAGVELYYQDSDMLSIIPEVPSITASPCIVNNLSQTDTVSKMERELTSTSGGRGASTLSKSPKEMESGVSFLDLEELSSSTSILKQKQQKVQGTRQTLPPKSIPGSADLVDISDTEEEESSSSEAEPDQVHGDKLVLQNIEKLLQTEKLSQVEDQFKLEFRNEPFYQECEAELLRFVQSKMKISEVVMDIREYLQMKCLLRKIDNRDKKNTKKQKQADLPSFPESSIISQFPLPEFDDVIKNPLEARIELAGSGKAGAGCLKSVVNYRNAFMTLPGEWLNDEIINGYAELINYRRRGGCTYPPEILNSTKKPPNVQNPDDHCLNTFFFLELKKPKPDMNKAARILAKRDVDIKSISRLFLPLHQNGNHWVFVVLDIPQLTITFYDSLGEKDLPDKETQALVTFMKWILSQRGVPASEIAETQIKVITVKNNPRQQNCSDCGVFMLKGIDYLIRFGRLDFDQADMKYFRLSMLYELLYPERPLGVLPPPK